MNRGWTVLWALATALAATAGAKAEAPGPLQFLGVRGGPVKAYANAQDYHYLSTGATVTAWKREPDGTLSATGDTRTTPLPGTIVALLRHGERLYAAYGMQATISHGGVAVYSIAQPGQPQLLDNFRYRDVDYLYPRALAAAGGKLYVFDAAFGIHAASLDSDRLRFQRISTTPELADRVDVSGSWLFRSAVRYDAATVLSIADSAAPRAPLPLGQTVLPCCAPGPLRVRERYVFSFGAPFQVLDAANPADVQVIAQLPGLSHGQPILLGEHAWNVRRGAIDVLDLHDPTQPQHRLTLPRAFGMLALADGAGATVLVADVTGRLEQWDASTPTAPQQRAEWLLPGSGGGINDVGVNDIAFRGGQLFGAESDAVSVMDSSLQRHARHSLEADRIVIDGGRAYLYRDGAGITIADVSATGELSALNQVQETVKAYTARDGFIYASVNDFNHYLGAAFVVIDARDPQQPRVRGRLPLRRADVVLLHGNHAFVGTDRSRDPGFHILDISNPDDPRPAGTYAGCEAVQAAAIDPKAHLAVLGCFGSSVDIIDIADPAQPRLLHRRSNEHVWSVAVHAGRVYLNGPGGLTELDLADPQAPRFVGRLPRNSARMIVGNDARLYFAGPNGIAVYAADRLFAGTME